VSGPTVAELLARIADGRTDLVQDAVAAGLASTALGRDGVPLIAWCAYYGDVAAVRLLVDRGGSLAALGPNLGLADAAFHGHWRLCEFLLEHGADPNHADPDTGETALHAALTKPNRPAYELVVRVLLAAGADPGRATRPGAPTGAFMRDCRTRAETPLHRAAAFGSVETIRLLLAAGAAADVRDAHGESPLAWASWHTRPDAVLRALCYGEHRIAPDRDSTFDHGNGTGAMERALLGTPRGPRGGDGRLRALRLAIPLLHVSSAEAAERFYCGKLGFSTIEANRADPERADPCYLALVRDGVALHLSSFPGDGVPGGVAHMLVADVDALYEELRSRDVVVDVAPVDQTWGTREMYVKDADRNCLRFVNDYR